MLRRLLDDLAGTELLGRIRAAGFFLKQELQPLPPCSSSDPRQLSGHNQELLHVRRKPSYEKLIQRRPPPRPLPEDHTIKDFFISYNSADNTWAEWIAWTLEEAGYSVVIQAWDFRPGGNFVLEMQKAAQGTVRTLVVLSESYLQAEYTQPEWAAALVDDPRGDHRKLVPVRVKACSPGGMLKPMIYADLVGLEAAEAKEILLGALKERAKPSQPPPFPGADAPSAAAVRVMPQAVAYPALARAVEGGAALSLWREKLEFLQEQEVVAIGASQKFALRKQIEEAKGKIQELGGQQEILQREE